jgi:hypothetical protein
MSSLREAFLRDGYVIVEKVFSADAMSMATESLRAVLLNGDPSLEHLDLDQLILHRESQDHQMVYNAALSLGSSAGALRLMASSRLFDFVAEAGGSDIEAFHAMPLMVNIQLPSDDRFDYKWHQESTFYPWCPDILSVWFPLLRRSSAELGTMSIAPRTHAGGQREPTREMQGKFLQLISPISEQELEQQMTVEINPGDAIIFDSNLVHRSQANTGTVPRLTGIGRFVNMRTQPSFRPLYKALSYET